MAQGEDWISSQFNFDQPSLDYVANHYIYLDHDQTLYGLRRRLLPLAGHALRRAT